MPVADEIFIFVREVSIVPGISFLNYCIFYSYTDWHLKINAIPYLFLCRDLCRTLANV